jgi:L-lactate utilization protein LutB
VEFVLAEIKPTIVEDQRCAMEDCIEVYWQKHLEKCRAALEANNFDVYFASDPLDAGRVICEEIVPMLSPKSASWGDSMTLQSTGVIERLRDDPEIEFIETFEAGVPWEEIIERRRQALLVDLFLTGSNALTERGQLVNLDMIGNRVGGLLFGPKHVIVTIGRNKIVPDLEAAMQRIRNVAAPLNCIKHTRFKTPCQKTGYCHDCSSPDRICNTWTIMEKCFPPQRIKAVLINQDLGL